MGILDELQKKNCISNNWLISIRLKGDNKKNLKILRNEILNYAHSKNILLRPSWNLINTFSMYKKNPSGELKIAEDQAYRIINLPSSPQLINL